MAYMIGMQGKGTGFIFHALKPGDSGRFIKRSFESAEQNFQNGPPNYQNFIGPNRMNEGER